MLSKIVGEHVLVMVVVLLIKAASIISYLQRKTQPNDVIKLQRFWSSISKFYTLNYCIKKLSLNVALCADCIIHSKIY